MRRIITFSAQMPYIILMIIASVFFAMIFLLNNAGIIDMRMSFLSAGRHTVFELKDTLFSHRIYQWAEPQYSKFIENNVSEDEGVLFINDQTTLGQNFIYYNIYTYSDKKIRYFFDGKNILEESLIVKKMKENSAQYLFSYKNSKPIYKNPDLLRGKSYLLKLVGDKLELAAIYE
jgi:hypothetical protein